MEYPKYKAKNLEKIENLSPAQWEIDMGPDKFFSSWVGETIDNKNIHIWYIMGSLSCRILKYYKSFDYNSEEFHFNFTSSSDSILKFATEKEIEIKEIMELLEDYIDFSECVFNE